MSSAYKAETKHQVVSILTTHTHESRISCSQYQQSFVIVEAEISAAEL